MRRFRPARPLSPGWLLAPISSQRFLNLRTYVHHREEPGALFLWGWLSKPASLSLPTFDLPCAFAKVDYHHDFESGKLRGDVKADASCFGYRAAIDPRSAFELCAPDSAAEFAMERYSGFFYRGNRARIFRAWHPPWLQTSLEARIEDHSLLTRKFKWFEE